MGGATPGLVALGPTRKHVEQVTEIKQHPSMASAASAFASRFLPFELLSWLPLMMNRDVEVEANQTFSSPSSFGYGVSITAVAAL